MDKINKVFVINLEKDKHRYINAINQFKKYRITNYEFFKAINGNNLTDEEYKSYTTSIGYYITSPSMVGCGISHIKLWEKIVKENIQYSLILEDDFIFKDNFINNFNELMKNVPKKFDVLYLNSNIFVNKYLSLDNINDYVYKPLFIIEFVGYVITLEGAKKLLKKINKVAYHIDFQITINYLFYNKDFNIITAKKAIIYQEFNSSNNTYDYNYPLIINKIVENNYILNYVYKLIVLSIYNFKINLNLVIIILLGYFFFPYALLLILFEYFIIEKYNNLMSNIIILYLSHLIKVLI